MVTNEQSLTALMSFCVPFLLNLGWSCDLLLPNKMWWKRSSRIAELGHKKPYGFCLTWMFPLGSIPLGDLWQDQASWADHMEKNEVFQSTCQQTSQLTAGINCQPWDWVRLNTQPSCCLTASLCKTSCECHSAKLSIHSTVRDNCKLLF